MNDVDNNIKLLSITNKLLKESNDKLHDELKSVHNEVNNEIRNSGYMEELNEK